MLSWENRSVERAGVNKEEHACAHMAAARESASGRSRAHLGAAWNTATGRESRDHGVPSPRRVVCSSVT